MEGIRIASGVAGCGRDDLVAGLFSDLGVFVLAQGHGGSHGGFMAARIVVEALREHLAGVRAPAAPSPYRASVLVDPDVLVEALHVAHRRVMEATRTSDGRSWGFSTIAALHVDGRNERVRVLHVGDVRVYRVAEGRVMQLTRDHTFGEEHERLFPGAPPEVVAELRQGSFGRTLTRGLGYPDPRTHTFEELEVDVAVCPRGEGDVYLLCDAGLHGAISEDEIRAVLVAAPGLPEVAAELAARAEDRTQRGAGCVLVRVGQG